MMIHEQQHVRKQNKLLSSNNVSFKQIKRFEIDICYTLYEYFTLTRAIHHDQAPVKHLFILASSCSCYHDY